MHFFTIDQVFSILETYKYLLLFPIAILEGPLITVIAGYLSFLGFLSFPWAYLAMVLGDLAGDIIYYSAGRWGRLAVIEKYGHYIGISAKKIIAMEKIFGSQEARALIGGKFTLGIGGIIILAAGAIKMPFKKFIAYCTIGTAPKSFLLMLLGYYFGHAYHSIGKIFDYTTIGNTIIFAIILTIYYITQKYAWRIFPNTRS